MKRSFRTWFLTVTIILILFVVVFFTYAWFTSNRAVSTNTVTARTDEENLELQLSSTGGSSFRDSQPASITQVNKTDAEYLIPVSTNDLQNFVYSPFTDSGMASSFERVQNEEYYYHGRVYIRAVGEVFDENYSSEVIFKLSESQNASGQQTYNTVINGQTLGNNQVLSYTNGTVRAASDPSVSADGYTISFSDDSVDVPQNALLTMQLNKIYTVDIYFYLEGCDPDCSNSIQYSTVDLQLGFYGVLSQEGA